MDCYKKNLLHIIVWMICGMCFLCGMNLVFWGAILALALDIIILLYQGKTLQNIKQILKSLIIPFILSVLAILRVWGKIFIFLFGVGFCFFMQAEANTPLDQAKIYIHDGDNSRNAGDYISAEKKYWQAATLTNYNVAVERLSDMYTQKKYKNHNPDWEQVRSNLQKTADIWYPSKDAKFVDTQYILVAREQTIIEQALEYLDRKTDSDDKEKIKKGLYIDRISKFPKELICGTALDIVKKDIKVRGKNGDILVRSRCCNDAKVKVGIIALVDKETAKERFDGIEDEAADFTLYVRCPVNPNLLIPFDKFHEKMFDIKMNAFIAICREMQAKQVEICYENTSVKSKDMSSKIELGLPTYVKIREKIAIANKQGTKKIVWSYDEFDPSCLMRRFSTPWFDRETSWKNLYKHRTSLLNSNKEKAADFEYKEFNHVNVEIATALQVMGWGVGGNVKYQKDTYNEINLQCKVTFKKLYWLGLEIFSANEI